MYNIYLIRANHCVLGNPKGVVRDNGGHAVALKWSLSNIFDIHPGDVWWAASDVGWVVGHSYIVYGPLLQGATSIMYEGKSVGTPDVSVNKSLTRVTLTFATRLGHSGEYYRSTKLRVCLWHLPLCEQSSVTIRKASSLPDMVSSSENIQERKVNQVLRPICHEKPVFGGVCISTM